MFWFMTRILNPLMLALLRSRFHSILSQNLLAITVFGKRSGKPYSLVTNYFQDGDILTIVVGMPDQKSWWRNLRGGSNVELVLRGQRVETLAELIEGTAAHPEAVGVLQAYLARNPSMAASMGVVGDSASGVTPESLRHAAEKLVAVRARLGKAILD